PLNGDGHKLWPIIAPQIGWRAIQCDEVFQSTEYAMGRTAGIDIDIQFFACEFVHDRQNPQCAPIQCLILDKVVGPDVIWIGRSQGRWPIAMRSLSPGAFDLQPRVLPQPMDTLAIDGTLAVQQRVNAAIAVARMLVSKLSDIRKQRLLIRARTRLVV